jgi:hypothetical protein
MAPRRAAIAGLVITFALVAPACRFSRSSDRAEPTSTTPTLETFADDTSTSVFDDTSTSTDGSTSTTARHVTTTARSVSGTTRATTRVVTTTRPTVPHCTASAPNTYVGSTWTVSVTSTSPNTTVVLDLHWGEGNAGNYSGITGPDGSFTKSQRVPPTMRGQTVTVAVTVGSLHCSTSFTVS